MYSPALMATSFFSVTIAAGGVLGFRRNDRRLSQAIKAFSPLSSRSHVGSSFRFGNALKWHENCRSRGFPSETDPNIGPPKANKSDSSGSDSPPLATILAGIVVFLLFLWVVGSIFLWIVGLIVNVPKS